jgi:hypothetical protein
MHNQRRRHASTQRPSVPGKPPAFPAEVTVPPHRGAVSTAIDLPAPAPELERLFALTKAKPASKKRKPAALRRKAQRKAKATGKPPRRGPRITTPALPLNQVPEPLVTPLPRNRAPALVRRGAVLDQIADWLKGRARLLWDRLGGVPSVRPAPRRTRPGKEAEELRRLRAENQRLKRQLAALVPKSSPRPVGRPVPQP